jgi:hypothetical protein
VVEASGGQVPKGSAIATTWLNYGQHVDPKDVQSGDIAVLSRGHRAGETGGHVGIVGPGGFDPKTGRFEMVQGNRLADYQAPERGYEFRRPIPPQGTSPANPKPMAEGGIVDRPTHALIGEQGPEAVVPLRPLGSGAARTAAGLRSYLEQGGRNVVADLKQSGSSFWDQLKQTIAAPSAAGVGKTALAGAGLGGSVLPSSIAAQALLTPGVEGTGFSHETASNIVNVGQALVNPLKGAALLPKLMATGQAAGKIGSSVAGPVAQEIGATRAMFLGDQDEDRSALDRRDFGGGFGGGQTEGTITIEHKTPPVQSAGPKRPLFRTSNIKRQSQMEPAAGGPQNSWIMDAVPPGM